MNLQASPGPGERQADTIAAPMNQRLDPGTAALLTIPPLLWAGNAVVGRLVNELVPPVTLPLIASS